MIHSFHLALLSPSLTLHALRRGPRAAGLRHAECLALMRLGSPPVSLERGVVAAPCDVRRMGDESTLDEFLADVDLGRRLNGAWHVRLQYLPRFGEVAALAGLPVRAGRWDRQEPIVAVTLARLKLPELPRFLKWGRPVERLVARHPGTTFATAAIRPPRTFSTSRSGAAFGGPFTGSRRAGFGGSSSHPTAHQRRSMPDGVGPFVQRKDERTGSRVGAGGMTMVVCATQRQWMNVVGFDHVVRSSPSVDAVVLTALAEEKAAVLAVVGEAKGEVVRSAGSDVHVASVGSLRIAVASLKGMGNVGAAAVAREVMEVWQPRFLILVGIAAGIRGHAKDLQLGDVMVADQVVGFELAKVTADGVQRRYQTYRPRFDLLAAVHAVPADEWALTMATPRPDGRAVPKVHVGTVLSGEKVFADVASVQEVGQAWPTAVGVEMEGLGVAVAAYQGGGGFLLVKGVSDFADAKKDDRWRGYAAEAAARLALAVLSHQSARPMTEPRLRQLPRDATWFTGRSMELEHVLAAASDPQLGSAVVISAIDGMAGVGKTALAVHAGHRLAWRFPDGQLFVDLHGFTTGLEPVAPTDALDRLLRDLGVPGERIPAGLDERAALWRSVLAGRQMLIVLDNAATEAQVRPLLPGTAGSLVIITSRRRLAALEASHTLSLDTLPQADAVLLFARTADRPELSVDASEVVELCGRLPLAIRLAAARLKHRRAWTMTDLVARLRDLDARVIALDDGQRSIHATLHLSYRALSAKAQRLYRLLGLHPGPDIDLYAAAALTADKLAAVQRLLDELLDDHLIQEPTPGRYRFHDLVRAHAADTVAREEAQAKRRAALGRLLDHYLHTAHAAATLLDPSRPPIPLRPLAAGVQPKPIASHEQAMAWFAAEQPVLLAAIREAGRWELLWALIGFLDREGRWREWTQSLHATLDAARAADDFAVQADVHRNLGRVYGRMLCYGAAQTHYARALDLYAGLADHTGQANCHLGLGWVLQQQGRYAEALGRAQQALVLFESAGNRAGKANALNAIGWHNSLLGQHHLALVYCTRALAEHQEIGNRMGEADTWDSIGHAHDHLGEHTEAASAYRTAIELYRAEGHRYYEAITLEHLAEAHLAAGDDEAARAARRSALNILAQLEHPDAERLRSTLDGPVRI